MLGSLPQSFAQALGISAGVFGRLDPHAGTGTLYYYDNVALSRVAAAATFRVTAPPWHTTGLQPIIWELIPNYDWESKPILRIALSREARLEWDNNRFSVPYRPLVIIYRPQDNQLMPTPSLPVEPHRMVAEPYTWFPGSEPFATPHTLQPRYFEPHGATDTAILPEWVYQNDRNYAHVMPVALGVVFAEARSLWQVKVFCPPNDPAAFAYELAPTTRGYHLRIVRTSNVRVRINKSVELEKEPVSQLLVQEMVAQRISQVPPQGSRLDLTRYRYRTVTKTDPSTNKEFQYGVKFEPKAMTLETRIGFIPIRPALFDVGRFVVSAGTGEDKLKSKVEEEPLLPLAILCLLKTTLNSTVLDKLIETLAMDKKYEALKDLLKKLKNKEFLEGIQEQTEYALFEAFQAITASTEKKLPDLIKAALSGGDALDKLIMLLNDEIGEDYIAFAEWRRLSTLFSTDMQGIHNPRLAMQYRYYLSDQTRPTDPRHNSLDWASDQTRGRPAAELVRELGREYSQRLYDAINEPMAPTLSASAKSLFHILATTIDTVTILQERVASWLHAFTADPLIEERFLTSDRVSSIIKHDAAPAMVLPKNPWIAKQLDNYTGYSQIVKSWCFNYLIPPGKEDNAKIQQWWDAHVYVYNALGANAAVLQRLRDPFAQIAQSEGERVVFRTTLRSGHFTPTQDWFVI